MTATVTFSAVVEVKYLYPMVRSLAHHFYGATATGTNIVGGQDIHIIYSLGGELSPIQFELGVVKMKSFSKFLKEDVGTSDQSRATDNGINPSEIQNPRVLRALNAYVGAIANMEYILPEQALSKLRSALDRVGYSFGAIPEMTDSGSFDLPLTRFGGRFGKDTDTPHDEVIVTMVFHTWSKVGWH